jgi:hypothetical protein
MTTQEKISLAKSKRVGRGFISVNSEEFKPDTYKGYILDNLDEEIKIGTGDFFIDSILLSFFTNSSLRSKCFSWTYSSSYDHFLSDSGEYQEVYIEWNGDYSGFKILNVNEMGFSELGKCDKVIFKKDMESFEDYITYWKNWKKDNKGFFENWSKEMELI